MTEIREEMSIMFQRLRRFELNGLHGYKNLSIDCGDEAAIILAENGVGKTTLLNVLYALLSGRISRLSGIHFKEAVLYFDNQKISFNREAAFKTSDAKDVSTLLNRRQARDLIEYGVTPAQLYELLRIYADTGRESAQRSAFFQRIYRTSPFDNEDIFSRLERLRSLMYDNVYISDFRKTLVGSMGEIQVLYLPTYRRIEATFDDMSMRRRSPTRLLPQFSDEDQESDQLIYFGLSDVEEKLDRMTRFIQQSMFEAYSRLSGNIFDALLGMRQLEIPLDRSLDIDSVRLMLGRLGKNNTLTERELERALSGSNVSSETYRPLVYFLQQLSTSYEASRPQETAIEEFVSVVNGYFEIAMTDKRLRFDKMKLKVDVWNEAVQKILPFGSLSSGEKQIVSVFSRLILDGDRKYLVMIDEPELSLSIEWQRRFLPDILKAKNCGQLIAITHSPFVFENELDEFARSISVVNSVE